MAVQQSPIRKYGLDAIMFWSKQIHETYHYLPKDAAGKNNNSGLPGETSKPKR